jgi:Family of unknown function (DUF5947)
VNGLARFVGPARPAAPVRPQPPGRADTAPLLPGSLLPGSLARPPTRPAAGEVCELCSAPTGSGHPHLVDVEHRGLLCACRSCALLFTGPGTGQERFRTVGSACVRVSPFLLSAAGWARLQIPVGLAFFMVHSQLGRTVAFYPSPAGATECDLPLEHWQDVVDVNPRLADLEADVEAALVRTESAAGWTRGPDAGEADPACFIVPIDRCYALIGQLRLHWRGFDGGSEVRADLGAFFADLERRAVPS